MAEQFNEAFDSSFNTALGGEIYNQTTGFWQGMQAYLASDYERPEKEYDVLWERGSAALLDLAPECRDGVAVLCIPSLINKSTILDLYPKASFVEFLKSQGLRPLILDWGSPGEDEQDFSPADYINAYALDALHTLRDAHDGPIIVLGYCMGGIFATAMAQLAPLFVDALILFATPWDFSAPETPHVLLDPTSQTLFRQWIGQSNPVPPAERDCSGQSTAERAFGWWGLAIHAGSRGQKNPMGWRTGSGHRQIVGRAVPLRSQKCPPCNSQGR